MSVTDRVLAACRLRPGPWPPEPRTCVWCAAPLTGRQRRWCAAGCEQEFSRNHSWGWARPAAIERDGGRCQQCGVDPAEVERHLRAWQRFLLVAAQLPRGVDLVGPWDRQQPHREWWEAARAVDRPRTAVADMVQARLLQVRLEVNHRTPILGRHGQFGCHHHLEGLETLCHSCHLDVTARQFGHRRPTDHQLTLMDAP